MPLTVENYNRGFLVDVSSTDIQWMGGVTEDPKKPGAFIAYIISPDQGEYLAYHSYPRVEEAIQALNSVPRNWAFESTANCGEGQCGTEGECSNGACTQGNYRVGSGTTVQS